MCFLCVYCFDFFLYIFIFKSCPFSERIQAPRVVSISASSSDPPHVNSNNPAHRYFLTTDPVTGRLYVSDTNSRRIYRPTVLSAVRDLMGKKSTPPNPVAKLCVYVSKCVRGVRSAPSFPSLHHCASSGSTAW